jgi:hypothetical protein
MLRKVSECIMKPAEIYTKGVERWKMAVDAMRTLEAMEW